METLKKIVRNQYFPAATVLIAVLLFWAAALLGGLSMLNDGNPPIATLAWMLFVYMAAVLTPLAGVMAAIDLVRRWRRNRQPAQGQMVHGEAAQDAPIHVGTVPDNTTQIEAAHQEPAHEEPAHEEPAYQEPAYQEPEHEEPVQDRPARTQTAQSQPARTQPAQAKPARKKAA